ncbi:GNAT family N-acetyltransferase [Paenibacillus endoradicis]|uniref:GNAT family N-acetyltransferase n=1 Tax=Paenibacillus endoradicis TaxID=2972487 RepID=UPI002158EC96|nr:GNAT family N-acetyltransferase [Paenibacillus endoradicis]MCR8657343.1 GNAT family N-acetyltransferase [Paenibacillus endoradicis]
MMITIVPPYSLIAMSEQDGSSICQWRYPSPYHVYNWPSWDIVKQQEIEFGDTEIRSNQYRSIIDFSGKLIGFVQLFAMQTNIRIALFLAPAYCGLGIGQTVMQLAIEEVIELYANYEIDLEVETWNERAIASYLRSGFVIADQYALPSRNDRSIRDVYCMVYQAQ